jgi:hypothetical protein
MKNSVTYNKDYPASISFYPNCKTGDADNTHSKEHNLAFSPNKNCPTCNVAGWKGGKQCNPCKLIQ